MNISQLLGEARGILDNPAEARILLSHALRCTKENLIAHPEATVEAGPALQFREFCSRRKLGVPVAYLTHHREFFGLDFYVDERVLIPRPETEMLVEEAILQLGYEYFHRTVERSPPSATRSVASRGRSPHVARSASSKNCPQEIHHSPARICDLGTGSGCIAVCLAKHLPQAKITAIDISPGALQVAQKNAEFHGVKNQIEFLKSDLLQEVLDISFDGIVANLPYIGLTESPLVSRDVAEFEPHQALFGGETGLELFEKLFGQLRGMRTKPRWVIGEMGFLQKPALEKMIKKYFDRSTKIEWKKDLAGLDRVFVLDNFCFDK
ncbi:MAG: HemK/PrmC family methyltransferase [Patescibacteria group bacterium]